MYTFNSARVASYSNLYAGAVSLIELGKGSYGVIVTVDKPPVFTNSSFIILIITSLLL